MKAIFGLGNPGDKYLKSRHNVGFLFLDYLVSKFGGSDFLEKSKLKSLISEIEVGGEKVILVKPTTFMNLSGESVVSVANFFKIDMEDICICYDDIDLPYGSVRYRGKGSAGTHNGMRSVIELTGATDIPRLRFGIEVEGRFMDIRSFVLQDFSLDELDGLSDMFEDGISKLDGFL